MTSDATSLPPPGWERPLISSSILDHVGCTPLVRLNKIGKGTHECEILAKCEFMNAGGSVKDRIGKRMILDAEKQGRIKPGDTIIEPTSGNTGIGLAITALIRGYRMIITLPEKMSNEKMNMLKALGAEIIRTPTEAAWDAPESHIGVAKRLHAQIPNSHILDQYTNPSNPLAHYEGTAHEILYQCGGHVDMVVIGAGTGGTITGIARRLKEQLGSNVRVVGVDPQGSILAQPDSLNAHKIGESYLVEGIGYDFIPGVLDRSLVDEWVKTDDASSLKMARRLVREEGLLCGGSSGAAMHAALLAAKRLGKGQRVVVLLPDASRNYMSKFIDDNWMVEQGMEPASLLSRPSALLRLIEDHVGGGLLVNRPPGAHLEWWADKTAVDLDLPSPITVPPTMAIAEAVKVMRAYGIDQLPVVDDSLGVVGVVTLGHLSSKILSNGASPRDPCSKLMFTRFARAPLNTKLAAFSRIFERDAFCLIVAPIRHLPLHAPRLPVALHDASSFTSPKQVVVAVCTQIDLLKFVMDGATAARPGTVVDAVRTASASPPHSPTASQPPGPPTSQNERGSQMDCAQLAWQFMKPGPAHAPSPPKTSPAKWTAPLPPAQIAQITTVSDRMAFKAEVARRRLDTVIESSNRVESLGRGGNGNEMDCAQLAWQFMKQPAMTAPDAAYRRLPSGRPSGHTSGHTTDVAEMAEAHQVRVWEEAYEEKAWREAHAEKALRDAYMEHAWRAALDEKAARDKAAAVNKATDGSRHAAEGAADRPELQCAQLAWSFVKLKRPPPASPPISSASPPISPATPPSSPETKHCASPDLPTSKGVSGMPAIDINATSAAGEAGEDRLATLDWSFGRDGNVYVDLKPTGTFEDISSDLPCISSDLKPTGTFEDNEASGAPTRFASCLASPAIPATTGCDGKALYEALPKMELK